MNDNRTAGETAFIDQYTRKMMVEWCHKALRNEGEILDYSEHQVYLDYAKSKGWRSVKDGKILSAGWKTAAAFLKR